MKFAVLHRIKGKAPLRGKLPLSVKKTTIPAEWNPNSIEAYAAASLVWRRISNTNTQ